MNDLPNTVAGEIIEMVKMIISFPGLFFVMIGFILGSEILGSILAAILYPTLLLGLAKFITARRAKSFRSMVVAAIISVAILLAFSGATWFLAMASIGP